MRDMTCLKEVHSSVHEAFLEEKFVVHRNGKTFSLMALDENQEHRIEFLKEDSGTKGVVSMNNKRKKRLLNSPKQVLGVMEEFENASLSV
jgi:hypothetical protein